MPNRQNTHGSGRFKLSTKLIFAFGFVIVLCATQAVVAIKMLSTIGSTLTFLVDDRMAKVNALGQFNSHLGTISNSVRNISLLDNTGAMAAEKAKIDAAQGSKADILDQLTATITTAQGKQRLQTLRNAEIPFKKALEEFMAMSRSGQRDQALNLLITEFKDIQTDYQEVVQELIEYQIYLSEQTVDQGKQSVSFTGLTLLSLALFALVVGSVIAWSLARSIGKQLGGEPHEASELARRVAAGDLSIQAQLKPGDSNSLMALLNAMQISLTNVVDRVRSNSASVADTSAEIAHGNMDLSARTERQAASLQETAASMEELGSTVRQNAESAREANQLAVGASTVATKGGEVVEQVVKNMKGIDESSKRIADILSVIDGIAFQTNILALNAAVEAARAGDHGRGFAVVATEVRSLAQRSADAAKEIKGLIEESVQRVEHGTDLVDQAGSTMIEIVSSISRVTQIMGEIANASTEQSAGVAQVGDAVTEMDKATQQNAALVEQSAAASETMREKANELVEAVSVFKLGESEQHMHEGTSA